MIATATKQPESMIEIANRDRKTLNEVCEEQRAEIVSLKEQLKSFQSFIDWRKDIETDIHDGCFDESGRQIKSSIQLDIGAQEWIPGEWYARMYGGRYFIERMEKDVYKLTEVI